ncbi:hypothetical protein GOC14_07005 [Sinorhizobium meliloti]|nr:hypothetical protein [Sinorhizobium meliloti]
MIPINVRVFNFGTVQYWNSYRKHTTARTWRGAMRTFAAQHGKAIAMRCDGSAFLVYRDENRKSGFRQETIPATGVQWLNI